MLGTMAMVVVMSVFNGFSGLFDSLLSEFDPDLKITATEGKMFDPQESGISKLQNHPGIVYYSEVLEEPAMLKYDNRQITAIVKGVPGHYSEYTGIDTLMTEGKFILENNDENYAVIGRGVLYELGIGASEIEPLQIFVPRRDIKSLSNLTGMVNSKSIQLSGVFAILEDIDSKYIIVPMRFAKEIFQNGNEVSAVELTVDPKLKVKEIQKQIKTALGEKFHVKTKHQQHELIYKTTETEKVAANLIIVFIIIIASINLIGSISMLILNKKTDISILSSMGATLWDIRKIFLFEGWLVTFLGAVSGIILGILLCWIQIQFGIIRFPGNSETFVIQAYPVNVKITDVLITFVIVSFIGLLTPILPVRYIQIKN
jgi:lipoprotein-releasing system permease protein